MRNPHAPHIDFTELNGIAKKCVPSNIDMIYERNGYFLVGEWKRKDEMLSMGQAILLRQLASQPNFLVLLIQGDTDNGMDVDAFWRIRGTGARSPKGKSKEELKEYIKRWFDKVEKLK